LLRGGKYVLERQGQQQAVIQCFRSLMKQESALLRVFLSQCVFCLQETSRVLAPFIEIPLRFNVRLFLRQGLRPDEGMTFLFVEDLAVSGDIDKERPAARQLVVDVMQAMDDRNDRRLDPVGICSCRNRSSSESQSSCSCAKLSELTTMRIS
jgi:hypothetical protein